MIHTITNEEWDEFWTLTMRAHRKRLSDNVFDKYPLLNWFRKNAMEMEGGGKEIQEDLEIDMQRSHWFRRRDILSTDAVDTVTAAFYQWRHLHVPISIDFFEEAANRINGNAAIKLLYAYLDHLTNSSNARLPI